VGIHPLAVALREQALVLMGAVEDSAQVVVVPAADSPIFQLA